MQSLIFFFLIDKVYDEHCIVRKIYIILNIVRKKTNIFY